MSRNHIKFKQGNFFSLRKTYATAKPSGIFNFVFNDKNRIYATRDKKMKNN